MTNEQLAVYLELIVRDLWDKLGHIAGDMVPAEDTKMCLDMNTLGSTGQPVCLREMRNLIQRLEGQISTLRG